MTEMLYDHGAGDALAQAFKVQAQMLHEHADDLMRAGTQLVSEHLQGAAAEAFINTLQLHTNNAKDIAQTIMNHSGAVTASFTGMHHTDVTGAQAMQA
jgi:uncharacterized protein YukE